MWGCMCSAGHSSLGDREDISETHLIIIIIIIKSEIVCLSELIIPSHALGFIYIPGKLGRFFTTAQSYDVCK